LAAAVDVRSSRNPVLYVNLAISAAAAIGLAVAAADDLPAVLRVWGVWAIVAGEYLRTADSHIRDGVAAALENPSAPDFGVRAIANHVASQIKTPGFRGCAFLNAAAEYPELQNPIHQAILTHRTWFYDTVRDQFDHISDRAELAAKHFVMLRDGAMVAGCLSDPETTTTTFLHGIDGMLGLGPHRQD
jgi:hypothetical protein